jgi:hypothetical protein
MVIVIINLQLNVVSCIGNWKEWSEVSTTLSVTLQCFAVITIVSKHLSSDYIIIFLFTEETKFIVIIVRRY